MSLEILPDKLLLTPEEKNIRVLKTHLSTIMPEKIVESYFREKETLKSREQRRKQLIVDKNFKTIQEIEVFFFKDVFEFLKTYSKLAGVYTIILVCASMLRI